MALVTALAFFLLQAPAPPGVVITHIPASTGTYVGSPGIVVLPGGAYLAKMDLFGPNSTERTRAVSRIFRSDDRGRTWWHVTDVDGIYWASIFWHRGALYLIGPEKNYGNLVIRRSTDNGRTWTEARDEHTGLLAEGKYHTAPTPIVVHHGRLWRAFEDAEAPGGWGELFRAFMLSAPEKANLLERSSWTFSNRLPRDASWLNGTFKGWLEGNAVVTPSGSIVDILRVDTPEGGKAAIIGISSDGRTASFDPAKDFIDFPGGAVKFTIRYDRRSKQYWSITSFIPPEFQGRARAGATRNTLALISSPNLRHWTVRRILIQHPDLEKHGFQYVDWLFEGSDIIAVCRTAFDDAEGGAHNYHDANYLTFHRIERFRDSGLPSPAP
jgi:hypothetical protein